MLKNHPLDFDFKRVLAGISRGIAFLLALAVISLALFLLVRGVEISELPEEPLVSSQSLFTELPGLSSSEYFKIYWPAVVYLLGGLGIILGLTRQDLVPAAWISWILLSIWSVLYLFSSGAALLPLDLGLLVCLIFVTITWRSPELKSQPNLLDIDR